MLYTKYLTEVDESINDKLDSMLSKGLKPCLKAPTGTGKTTLIYKRMQKEAERGSLSVLALPFKSIADNKKEQASVYGIHTGYAESISEIPFTNNGIAIQTTFESALNILKNTSYSNIKLYIDEAHLILGHSGFRHTHDLLELDNVEVIALTATPEAMEVLEFTIYEPQRAIKTPIINIKALITSKPPESTVNNLITQHNKDKVLQIRINSKDLISKACNMAKVKGLKYVAVYSADKNTILAVNQDSGLTESEIMNAQNGIFSKNIDLILNTSKLDAGLDFTLEGSRDLKFVAVGRRESKGNIMPNIPDLAQSVNRMRWSNPNKADISIVGQFGTEVSKDTSRIYKGIKELIGTIKALEALKYAAWDITQYYNKETYNSQLNKFNVNISSVEVLDVKYKAMELKRHASIFIRLNQFEGFKQTQEKAKMYGFNLLDYCIAQDNSEASPSAKSKANEIMGHLERLFDYYGENMPIESIWTGKTYSRQSAEALILVARAMESNTKLGRVMNEAVKNSELIKSNLSKLVKSERKAVSKYLQIIYKVNPVKISDKRKKTIKLIIKDKEASSVVTVNDSHLKHIESNASKSLIKTQLTNEQINAYITSQLTKEHINTYIR